jgi:hypothetical protein
LILTVGFHPKNLKVKELSICKEFNARSISKDLLNTLPKNLRKKIGAGKRREGFCIPFANFLIKSQVEISSPSDHKKV